MIYRQLIKKNKLLMYKISYKNVKNITAKIDKNNELIVTCPSFINDEYIDEFVMNHFDKFYEFITKKNEDSLINLNENKISLLGIPYELKINIIPGREKYEIIGNKIYLFLKKEENKQKIINKLLNDLGHEFLIKKVRTWLKIMNETAYKIDTKWYHSKWGQCEYISKSITLAIQLYMMNESLIDYVVIHEICHLEFPDHSNNFWNKVEKYYPQWKIARNKLKYC